MTNPKISDNEREIALYEAMVDPIISNVKSSVIEREIVSNRQNLNSIIGKKYLKWKILRISTECNAKSSSFEGELAPYKKTVNLMKCKNILRVRINFTRE